jgi:hypothetical protein
MTVLGFFDSLLCSLHKIPVKTYCYLLQEVFSKPFHFNAPIFSGQSLAVRIIIYSYKKIFFPLSINTD